MNRPPSVIDQCAGSHSSCLHVLVGVGSQQKKREEGRIVSDHKA